MIGSWLFFLSDALSKQLSTLDEKALMVMERLNLELINVIQISIDVKKAITLLVILKCNAFNPRPKG